MMPAVPVGDSSLAALEAWPPVGKQSLSPRVELLLEIGPYA